MKKFFVATVSAATLYGASAFAADLPMKAAPMLAPASAWQGFYIGLNAGYASGKSNPTQIAAAFTVGAQTFPSSLKPTGFIGGGQIGYNWQTGAWLLGTELDFSGLSAKSSQTIGKFTSTTTGPATFSSQYDWLLTARVRTGVAVTPNWLVYATGGFAAAGAKDSINNTNTGDGVVSIWSESKTLTGWTVGGGMEYAIVSNWSFKAEYLYVKLSDTSPPLTTNTNPLTINHPIANFDHSLNIVRAGVNYRF